jgi:uncharacterized membrane protein SpoIIM required for sporulation/uncharacterized RDD family membrane protein YckC
VTALPAFELPSATGVDVRFDLAGAGARSMAFLFDFLLRAALAACWYVGAALLYNLSQGRSGLGAPLATDARWFMAVLLPAGALYLLYHPLLETALRGLTPGKRLAGLRIVTRDGGVPSTGALVLRNLFRIIDSLPVFYGVGLGAMLLTREQTRIGDVAAGTLVVYDREVDSPAAQPGGARPAWQQAAARLARLARHETPGFEGSLEIAADYRRVAADLSQLRQTAPGSAARETLETLYSRLHRELHHAPARPLAALATLLRDALPASLARVATHLLVVTALFVAATAAGAWLVTTQPELARLFASPEMISTVERGRLWTEGLFNIMPSSVLSVQVLTNNIAVSLFAYCAGMLFGLGTLYIVALNGLMLGSVFAFTAANGLGPELFEFVVAHGVVEISCLCLSGAAGAAVGNSLVRPGTATRRAAFARATHETLPLMTAVLLLLVGCGFIEGYVSPNPQISLAARLAIGFGYLFFMIALLRGWLFGRPRTAHRHDPGAT